MSALANFGLRIASLPTKISFKSGLFFKQSNDAGIVTSGPKSPPIASIDIVRLTLTDDPRNIIKKAEADQTRSASAYHHATRGEDLLFVAIAYDLATFKEAVWSNMMANMNLTSHRILRQGSAG
jgi:hypothetical protein